MTFEPTIGLGSVIGIVVTLLGVAGVWFTMKERLNQLWERAKEQDKQHDENQKRMATFELQIAKDCVQVEDFRRFEDKQEQRFLKIEHTVNNSAAKTVQSVKEALRDMLPARDARGRE